MIRDVIINTGRIRSNLSGRFRQNKKEDYQVGNKKFNCVPDAPASVSGKGKLAYKVFWTWDHSTNWCLNTLGTQNCGVGNHYTKKPDVFIKDYRRAVDWCAAHKIDAIGIVGLLRDSHGGFTNARKICAYAREHGVRIYLIAGLYSYGGIYYEGDSFLSLDRFFANNPECIGKGVDGSPQYWQFENPHGYKRQAAGCPSNRKLRNFVLDSLDYVFHAIPELGGIQMETGDSFVCMCEQCRARRAEMQGGEEQVPLMSFSDMADIYPEAADVVWRRSPDAWVICETYTHFLDCKFFDDPDSPALKAILKMPDKTFWQWKCDSRLAKGTWLDGDRLQAPLRKFRHIMRAHHGTQWLGGRHTLAVDDIRRQCRLSFESGVQGVSIFGEGAPFHTNVEFNYLALQYFADHPMDSLHSFAENVMAPLLGGTELAGIYLEYGLLNKIPEKIPDAVKKIAGIIHGIKDYETLRRWCYLSSFLNAFYWESTQFGNEKRIEKHSLDMM